MKPLERLQQVEQLFHAALELEPARRAAFLSEACSSDPELLAEVESLLAADAQEGSFLDSPAYAAAVEMFTDDSSWSMADRQIGPYKVKSLIGRGGMGEIYLAKDTRLGRPVALKLLPAHFTKDESRLRRFKQESRAASALNHPNILTIYEIGETDGTHFIATEYIEGETLRQHMKNQQMTLREVLDAVIQIGGALAAAHQAGIIHRDIKPENIMLRPDGYVKVLDFGLAKLTEKPRSASDSEASTFSIRNTDPGMIMGTVQYMSPEQARGKEVDGRSDIFSLGVVLYEIIAGRPPFAGESSTDILAAILDKAPPPLAHFVPDIPDELQQIVSKALNKEREMRYQTTNDLLVDLKEARDNLQAQLRLGRLIRPESQGDGLREATFPSSTEITADPPATSSNEVVARRTSSIGLMLSGMKRHKGSVALVLAALIVIAGGITFWLSKSIRQHRPLVSPQSLKITPLTSTGKVTHAAISPDGKYVVYVLSDKGKHDKDEGGGQQSLWVTQVAVSSNVQIVPPAEAIYLGITFARDGNFIYYVRKDKEHANGALFQSPLLGGQTRKLLDNIASPIALSPDGKQFAFVRWDLEQHEDALMVANADGTEEKKLAVCKLPDQFSRGGPAWSPDGKFIAFSEIVVSSNSDINVIAVRVADGTKQPITSSRWTISSPTRIAWLSDNSGVLLTLAEPRGNPPSGIWRGRATRREV